MVHFVLYRSKESLCQSGVNLIINTRRINISHFLVEHPLTATNITNTLKEFLKIACSSTSLLKPFVIHGKTLNQVLSKSLCRPCAKLGSSIRPYPIADRQNCI